MNLILSRMRQRKSGCFGQLETENGTLICYTLEHAYPDRDLWMPKVPVGTYPCIRGTHQLDHAPEPFETFEITEVPGHSGILFHCGNMEDDSAGCVLLGLVQGPDKILQSRKAFNQFMKLQAGVNEFTLVVC